MSGSQPRYRQTSARVGRELMAAFAEVDAWFGRSPEVRSFRPADGGWTIDEVLEHIALTNRYLLLTLGKWVAIAEHRARRGDPVPDGESDLDRLDRIGERGSFPWARPEHMVPTGAASVDEIRATLVRQRDEAMTALARLEGGIGALTRVRMTVDELGKVDLYQWIHFIGRHARRHLQQMAANAEEPRG